MERFSIIFEDVYKEYTLYNEFVGIKSFILNLPQKLHLIKERKFVSLKGISFQVPKGQTLAIIGKNGAGKSTILALVAGVIKPNRGKVIINGCVSSLLELGAGFHPELSGLDNIIINGILLGNTKKEIMKKIDKIIEFSELGDFVYQPLRTYSAGMQLRLAFSVAIHIETDILLIDEVLSVGDKDFQKKCLEKIFEFKDKGVTVLFVSHEMSQIKLLADRVMWLEDGVIREIGNPDEVVEKYTAPEKRDTKISDKQKITPIKHIKKEKRTWWKCPYIIQHIEKRIVGNENSNFYEFLKKYIHKSLNIGISFNSKIADIEDYLMSFNICKKVDIINVFHVEEIIKKKDSYELLLTIDFLGKLNNDKRKEILGILRKGGYFIGIEYLGDKKNNKKDDLFRKLTKILSYKFDNPIMLKDKTPFIEVDESLVKFLEEGFEILDVRYFGGPLYEELLDELIERIDWSSDKDRIFINAVLSLEEDLIKMGFLKNLYGTIIARKI